MSDNREPFDDSQAEQAREKSTVTNDAVAGETVEPVDSFAGPNGAEEPEAEPVAPPRDERLLPEDIDLREDDDPSEDGSPDVGRSS